MKKGIYIISGLIAAAAPQGLCASLEFSGLTEKAVSVEAPASSGLSGIYVLPYCTGVTVTAEVANAASSVSVSRFSNLGGAYGEPVSFTRDGNKVSFAASDGDMGYIVEEAGRQTAYWLTDYSTHRFEVTALGIGAEQDCDRCELSFAGNAGEIAYYSVTGRRQVISRDIEVNYSTLRFDADRFAYVQENTTETLASINGNSIHVPSPLCSTSFAIHGDRFLRVWGEEVSMTTETFTPVAVEAQTRATQTERDNDNEQKADGSDNGLGGSAPCEIHFEASVTDAAIFREWQISRDPEFGINENTYSDLDFDYTFTDNGTTYVRFVANNADGTCEYVGETYQIFIGESRLEIPNAFSPQGSPGVNDEWKVSYKSLVKYECHIFNRWGKELFSSTNPAQGWDGKNGSKYVPAGVYFYVITAEGADGVKYKRSGDINIINYRESRSNTGQSDSE